MINNFVGLLLFLSTLLQAQTMRVMSFNIRLSLDSDKENSWQNRRPETTALLKYYEPDILGLQEAVPQQMVDLKSSLQNYRAVGVGRDDGADKGEYSAIFYNQEKFTLLRSGTFWLSETPEAPSKGWDAAYNRICTYALFKTKKGGKKFWAFNVHFDHVGNVARQNSAQLILDKIGEFNTKNYPVILTGDFNLTEDSAPIKLISNHLEDAYYHSAKAPYGPKGTFQAFDTGKPAKDRIDYIFTKKLKVLSLRTINDRRENLLYPSDHFPVMA